MLVATSIVTCLLVALGGIVCATRASGGCPDWPRCQGRLIPPLQMSSILEYTHRVVALLTGVLITTAAVVGWCRPEAGRALRVLPTIGVVLTIVVAIFGAFAVLTGLPPLLAAADLGTALVVLALVVAAAAIGCIDDDQAPLEARPPSHKRLAALSASALGMLFVVLLMGVLVARGSVMRCLGGPLHIGPWGSLGEASSWPYALRQLLAAMTVLLIIAVAGTALQDRGVDPVTRRWTMAVLVLFVLETALNAAMVALGAEGPLLIGSAVAAAGMWSALVVVVVRTRLPSSGRATVHRSEGGAQPAGAR